MCFVKRLVNYIKYVLDMNKPTPQGIQILKIS